MTVDVEEGKGALPFNGVILSRLAENKVIRGLRRGFQALQMQPPGIIDPTLQREICNICNDNFGRMRGSKSRR